MQTLADLKRMHEKLAEQLTRKEKQVQQLDKQIARTSQKLSRLQKQRAALLGAEAPTERKQEQKQKPVQRRMIRRRRGGPSQRELVCGILAAAGKAMPLDSILEQMKAKGYHWRSKNPKQALSVLLYPNKKIFKKVRRGCFTLQPAAKAAAAQTQKA